MDHVGIVGKYWYPYDTADCKACEEYQIGMVGFVCFPVVEEWLYYTR